MKSTLIDRARQFVMQGENAFKGLAIAVVQIEQTEAWKKEGYESFADFYTQDLGREKSTISRLRTAGEVLIAAGYTLDELPAGNFSYARIADIKRIHPDMEPKLLIATAAVWDSSDVKREAKENCLRHDLDLARKSAPCKHCGMWIKVLE